MNEKRANPRPIAGWIQQLRLAIDPAIRSKERLPRTPASARHETVAHLGNKVGSIPDQLRVDTQSGSQRRLDLFLGIVAASELAGRNPNQRFNRRDVAERRAPKASDDPRPVES